MQSAIPFTAAAGLPPSTATRRAESQRAPTLPREFYVRSSAGAYGFIALSLSLWLVPGALASWLARSAHWSWWALGPALALLCFVASHGLHLLGWVGHEGFHFNLFHDRVTSAIVGVLVSSPLVVFLQTGVAIEHFNHHRFANTDKDPDLALFSRQQSFWARLFLTRSRANRAFLGNAWRLARGLPLAMDERGLPLPRSVYERLSRLNFVCCLLWFASYVLLFELDALRATLSVVVPLVLANLCSGLRPYLEHTNTDARLRSCARSRNHWWIVAAYFGNSLHFEHHLYPSVPCYRLPRVRRWLLKQGFVSPEHPSYDQTALSSWRWALATHRYGTLDSSPTRSQT
ncbi:MAG TPA: fatty acid desaturase [Polyangiaceae bacterium]|nr:fatty acid desaturase [Polyangiaceae bacterium]